MAIVDLGQSATGRTQSFRAAPGVGGVVFSLAAATSNPFAGMPAYYSNFTTANTARLKAMKAAVIAGTGRGRILGGIDSFMMGYGSTASTTDGWAGSEVNSMMPLVAGYLNAKATPVPTSISSMAFDNGAATITVYAGYDTRFVSNNTQNVPTIPVLGGSALRINTYFDWTPGGTFDTIEFMHLMNTTASVSFKVSVDGGSTFFSTISCTDTSAYIKKTTLSCPAGSTTVRVQTNSGVPFLSSIATRTAASPKIELLNAGSYGRNLSTVNTLSSVANNSWNWLATLGPLFDANAINACILEGGYNDWATNGNNTANAVAALNTTIQNLQAKNIDIVFVTYGNLNAAAGWSAAQTALTNAAIAAGLPVVDLTKLLPAFNAPDWYDNYHMRTPLQSLAAQAVANIFDYL